MDTDEEITMAQDIPILDKSIRAIVNEYYAGSPEAGQAIAALELAKQERIKNLIAFVNLREHKYPADRDDAYEQVVDLLDIRVK
jgi:hypothetical protein